MSILIYAVGTFATIAVLYAVYVRGFEKGADAALKGSGVLTGADAREFERRMKENEENAGLS